MSKNHRNKIPENFAAVRKSMLFSEAYYKLSGEAARLLNYFLYKGGAEEALGNQTFKFSYTEAEKYGFARRTFRRCVKELVTAGYIKKGPGGLKGPGGVYCAYSLSYDWMKNLKPQVPKISKYLVKDNA